MKLIILLLCMFLVTHRISGLSEKQLNATKKLVRNTCQNKSKATSEAIDAMQKGDFNQDKNAQCYIYCLMSTYNLQPQTLQSFTTRQSRHVFRQMNKDLEFDWEGGIKVLKANAPESIANPGAVTIGNCKDAIKTKSDKCIAATEIAKCFYADNPSNYFLP